MKVWSSSRRTCSPIFISTGSPGTISGEPPRSSSQFADHDTFIGLPLIRLPAAPPACARPAVPR